MREQMPESLPPEISESASDREAQDAESSDRGMLQEFFGRHDVSLLIFPGRYTIFILNERFVEMEQ